MRVNSSTLVSPLGSSIGTNFSLARSPFSEIYWHVPACPDINHDLFALLNRVVIKFCVTTHFLRMQRY